MDEIETRERERRAFKIDKLVSWVGLTVAAPLIIAGSLLTWAHNFVSHEVQHPTVGPADLLPGRRAAPRSPHRSSPR